MTEQPRTEPSADLSFAKYHAKLKTTAPEIYGQLLCIDARIAGDSGAFILPFWSFLLSVILGAVLNAGFIFPQIAEGLGVRQRVALFIVVCGLGLAAGTGLHRFLRNARREDARRELKAALEATGATFFSTLADLDGDESLKNVTEALKSAAARYQDIEP
ncbi:MAG: hypothetical protein ACKVX7_09845 [Planctomycetota bacterium]